MKSEFKLKRIDFRNEFHFGKNIHSTNSELGCHKRRNETMGWKDKYFLTFYSEYSIEKLAWKLPFYSFIKSIYLGFLILKLQIPSFYLEHTQIPFSVPPGATIIFSESNGYYFNVRMFLRLLWQVPSYYLSMTIVAIVLYVSKCFYFFLLNDLLVGNRKRRND